MNTHDLAAFFVLCVLPFLGGVGVLLVVSYQDAKND